MVVGIVPYQRIAVDPEQADIVNAANAAVQCGVACDEQGILVHQIKLHIGKADPDGDRPEFPVVAQVDGDGALLAYFDGVSPGGRGDSIRTVGIVKTNTALAFADVVKVISVAVVIGDARDEGVFGFNLHTKVLRQHGPAAAAKAADDLGIAHFLKIPGQKVGPVVGRLHQRRMLHVDRFFDAAAIRLVRDVFAPDPFVTGFGHPLSGI